MKLETKRLGRWWWITGDAEWLPCGPYATRAEADEDRRGLARYLRHGEEPGFATSKREEAE